MASLSSRRQFLPPIDSPLDLFSPQRSPPLHSPSPWVPITTNMSLLTPLEEEDEGDDDDLTHRLHSTSLNPQASTYLPLSLCPLPPHSTPPPSPPALRTSRPLPSLSSTYHPTEAPLTPPPEHHFDPAPGSPIHHRSSSSLPVTPRAQPEGELGSGDSRKGGAPWSWPGVEGVGEGTTREQVSSSSGVVGGEGWSSSAMAASREREREGRFAQQGAQGGSSSGEKVATRYVLVEGVPRHSSEADLRELIINRTPLARGCATHVLNSSGMVVLRFGDVRDAMASLSVIGEVQIDGGSGRGRRLKAKCASRKEVEQLNPIYTPDAFLSPWEGTLALTLLAPSLPNPPPLIPLLLPLLQTFGPIRSITPFDDRVFLCEFWDDGDAERAEEALNGKVVQGLRVGVTAEPSVHSTTLNPISSPLPRPPAPHSLNPIYSSAPPFAHASSTTTSCSSFPPPTAADSYLPYSIDSSPPSTFAEGQGHGRMTSPGCYATVGSTLLGVGVGGGARGGGGSQETVYGLPPPSALAPTWGIYRDDKIPASNVIHFERIEQGLDVRTTIMLKNIPNKLGDEEVMRFIEEVAGQCWDVVYVRQDWKTGLNVGYGFINFVDTASLLRFARARIGTRWDLCGSDKLCIASYANIQGKASLIAHFRNSSVLDQPLSRRPKLFYSSGLLKGQPEPFPACDDPIRRARSAANASALGLFPSQKPVFRVAQALRSLNI